MKRIEVLRETDGELLARIDAALERIKSGQGQMRVPADMTDPDLVLAECRKVLSSRSATVTPRYLVYSYDKGQTTPHFTDHPKEWDGTDGDCSVLVDLHTGQRKAFGEWQAVDRYRCDSAARTETRLGVVPDQALPCESHGRAYLINLDGGITCAKCLADFCWFGKTNAAKPTEIAPTTEGLAGMVRNQQDAGADLLRAAHAAAKAEGTPLAEERRSGWIPVSERLPEPEIDVLVRGTNGFISIDSVESFEGFDVAVTHWMPLPDGPHGE